LAFSTIICATSLFLGVGFVGIVLDNMLELQYPFDFVGFNGDWFYITNVYTKFEVLSLIQGQHVYFL
jgi:hypothetical protein